jgi:hypothetical protein
MRIGKNSLVLCLASTLAASLLTGCFFEVKRPVRLTEQEAVEALRASDPHDKLCLAGIDSNGMELRVRKLSPSEELYQKGKYRVPARLRYAISAVLDHRYCPCA